MQHGSLVNQLSGSVVAQPEVGMGATLLMWSDRYPFTVVKVSPSGKTLWAQEDEAVRVDSNGMSDSQAYTFKPNPDARTLRFSLRKSGQWRGPAGRLALGYRSRYYDYSF